MRLRTAVMVMTALPMTGVGGWVTHFQVPGLGHRVSGPGVQVQVQVSGLIPEPDPVPAPAAETCDPRMPPAPVYFGALSFSIR